MTATVESTMRGMDDVRRVVLAGAVSTGKTTLARRLAEHFRTVWVPEYAREQWVAKLAALASGSPTPAWTSEELLNIAREQQRRESAAAARATRVLFCDTSALTAGLWHERYLGTALPELDRVGARDRADLYLLAVPDVPFVADGVRDGEELRQWMHDRLRERLQATGTPIVELSGDYEARFWKAVDAVSALLRP